jgi:hypothetical protein
MGALRGTEALTRQIPQERSGAELYAAACQTCHGPDGKGASKAVTGLEVPLPDFTDCRFSSPEPDLDWMATTHLGGPGRGFDRMMPAFGDALSSAEIARVVGHLRHFCADSNWPPGDLNLPRPLVTEKAFPENEALVTTAVRAGRSGSINSKFIYEHRLGARSQYEVVVPFALARSEAGRWRRGLGDAEVAFKHALYDSLPAGSILGAGAELKLPTGKESEGLGDGATVFEPFAAFGQVLPGELFLHLHAGFELPLAGERSSEAYWRAAVGRTFAQGRWGRAWSPMVEVLVTKDLGSFGRTEWDVVPQAQVSLSARQHVLVNIGVRLPAGARLERRASLVAYFLWDWFDGGLFSGW